MPETGDAESKHTQRREVVGTAVRALSEGLRQEVKPYNTVISPGAVATELPDSVTEPDLSDRRTFDTRMSLVSTAYLALLGRSSTTSISKKAKRAVRKRQLTAAKVRSALTNGTAMALSKPVEKRIGVVGLVADQGLWIDLIKQRLRAR